jgi:hypothetical protein
MAEAPMMDIGIDDPPVDIAQTTSLRWPST